MKRLSAALTHVAVPELRVAGRARSMFHVCGLGGFAAAVALALALAASRALPLAPFVVAAALTPIGFVAVVVADRALAGVERIVHYHHLAAVLAMSALVFVAFGVPVGRGLDVVAPAMALFVACGRLGCFAVGCCHGRPWRHGVCYGRSHARLGFPDALVGVPLIPVALLEAAALFAMAAARLGLDDYVVGYGLVRVALEEVRGDRERPIIAGVSEAQWTALVSTLLVVAVEHLRPASARPWHDVAAGLVAAAIVATVASRRRRALDAPAHLIELAALVRQPTVEPQLHETSCGIRLSVSRIDAFGAPVELYMISRRAGTLARRDAARLARAVASLRPFAHTAAIEERRPGLFQLVVGAPLSASALPTSACATSSSGDIRRASSARTGT